MFSTSGRSLLSYSLTKPYPFKRLTLCASLGGFILTILFSFVAVASNAYDLQSTYSTDPNTTVSNREWFQRAPFSWLTSMEATCQASLLTIGATYSTTNRGFLYTIDRTRVPGHHATDAKVLTSASYMNATLSACNVTQIHIKLSRNDNSRMPRNYWTWSATQAKATTNCRFQSVSGTLEADFKLSLPNIGDSGRIVDSFLTQEQNSTMFLGAEITRAWYAHISEGMSYSVPWAVEGSESWSTGSITLTRNPNVTDYSSRQFFICEASMTSDSGRLFWMDPPHTIEDWPHHWKTSDASKPFHPPNISTTVDAFGKSLYSLLLLDFGVNNISNAFLSPKGMETLQNINDTELATAMNHTNGGRVQHFYHPADKTVRFNTTTPPTLFLQYLCSVPKQKSGFTLFYSVVLADIVFLSACWTIFSLVATWWLSRVDPYMNRCEGCMAIPLAENHISIGAKGLADASDTERGQYSQELLPMTGEDSLSTRSLIR